MVSSKVVLPIGEFRDNSRSFMRTYAMEYRYHRGGNERRAELCLLFAKQWRDKSKEAKNGK